MFSHAPHAGDGTSHSGWKHVFVEFQIKYKKKGFSIKVKEKLRSQKLSIAIT